MNKHDSGYTAGMALVILLFLSLCLFCPVTVLADETDLYHESLKFDSNGNLLMTTRDKRAGSSVRYKTIGWTLKRTPDASGKTASARLKLEQNGASITDPTDPDYIFTYFKCDKLLIFAKIGEASAQWQRELYQNGGIIYMDAIMTVVENGIAQGYMDERGVLHGEVYTTAAGIMNARDWADAQTLKTHFNKAVCFPPLPDMIQEGEGEDDKEKVKITYGKEEYKSSNIVRIQAAPKENPKFDAEKGIPTGEDAFVSGTLQKYYYDWVLMHYYGTVAVPVEIAVTYTYLIPTDKGAAVGSFVTRYTYYVNRPYSYYRIDKLKLYALSQISVENESLPIVPVEYENMYTLKLSMERDRDSYLKIPTYGTSTYGGNLSYGQCISDEELQAIAERTAGNVWVRNDALSIDGEVLLDGAYKQAVAPEPVRQTGERPQSFESEAMTISHKKRNDTYDTYAVAVYKEVQGERLVEHVVKHVNPVVVHTPVVCKGGITDDIAHNQQVVPTGHFSLVLGRSFTVGISTVGTHKDQKGYGTGDYEKYTDLRQIRFPFEVYDGTVHYEKDVWIDLPPDQKTFYLPVGVHEGDYQIRYRTIAKNAAAKRGGIDCNGYLTNLELSDYGAYDELTVTVVGRMYDLAVTDIVDYPRWRSVFYGTDGTKRGYAFWIGKKNLEGDVFLMRESDGVFPILSGDHPFNPSARAVGLGYRVKLQLKTIGDMRGSEDCVVLFPTYYYVSRDGSRRQQVRLYQKKDLSEVSVPLVLSAQNRSFVPVTARNVKDPLLCAQSVQVWDGEYQLSPDLYLVDAGIDLDAYIRQHGGRIRQHDPVFLRDGYLLVQFEVRSFSSNTVNLSYANTKNAGRGYCNMWRLQGFSYERTDCMGNRFVFVDGDCLLFDTKYSLHSDYESWGTH